MKKYRVRVEYRGYTYEHVEAENEQDAEHKAVELADENMNGVVSVYGVDVMEEK